MAQSSVTSLNRVLVDKFERKDVVHEERADWANNRIVTFRVDTGEQTGSRVPTKEELSTLQPTLPMDDDKPEGYPAETPEAFPWNSTTIYELGEAVIASDGNVYISRMATNQGFDPLGESAYWRPFVDPAEGDNEPSTEATDAE
jgi:hypothetical protein